MCIGARICGSHTLAISLIGLTLYLGFPIVSTNTALVFSSIAAPISEGSSEVTNLTAIPYFLRSTTPRKIVSSGTHAGVEQGSDLRNYLPLNWLYVLE